MKKIPGYEDYKINEKAEIYSAKTNKMLKPSKLKEGWLKVNLVKNGKNNPWRVHLLMKKTFFSEKDKMAVEFIDGDKSNCELYNLRLVPWKKITEKAWKAAAEKRKRMVTDKVCEMDGCSNNISGYGRKYCEQCKNKAKKEKNKEIKRKKRKLSVNICKVCSYSFITRDSRKQKCKYHKDEKPKKKEIIATCQFCKEEFTAKMKSSICCGKDQCKKDRDKRYRKTVKSPKPKREVKKKKIKERPDYGCMCKYCGKKFVSKMPNAECCKSVECKKERQAEYQRKRKEKQQEMIKPKKENETIKRDMTAEEESLRDKWLRENGGSMFDKEVE